MPKRAVSVTLDADNLHWLHGQTVAGKARGLSDTLDRIVTDARRAGQVGPQTIRSVVGTIEIAADDPNLDHADAHLRGLYERSVSRPSPHRERTNTAPAVRRSRRLRTRSSRG